MEKSEPLSQRFDVAILGRGIASGLMGCILARQGLKVVIIDNEIYPGFALGESTIGETTYMLRILAERYDVPEIADCSSLSSTQQQDTSASEIKCNFDFVYHQKHEVQNQNARAQGSVSEFLFGPEMHFHRQDLDAYLIDAYLFYSAVKYGAIVRQRTDIKNVQVGSDGVTLTTATGQTFEVAYVVDAGGYGSVLARQFKLREHPPRFRTHSRTLFTHMVGVKPYAESTQLRDRPGTLHHIFDGGWVWINPFNNQEHLTSPLCSVGLNFDSQRFPKPADLTPQQEWEYFLSQFPNIAKQFADAHPVRDWVSTARNQFSSIRTVGDRWCMMSNAAGAIDPLFSRGMSSTTQVVNSAAALILQAFKDGDFSAQRFEPIDRLNQNLLDYNDRLVHGSYISFCDYNLWRAWFRIWFLSWNLASSRIAGTFFRYLDTRDLNLLRHFEQIAVPGSFCPLTPEFQSLFIRISDIMQRIKHNQTNTQEGITAIFDLFAESKFVPVPLKRHYEQTQQAISFRQHC